MYNLNVLFFKYKKYKYKKKLIFFIITLFVFVTFKYNAILLHFKFIISIKLFIGKKMFKIF